MVRLGFYISRALVGVSGFLTLVALHDPGRGATESERTKAAGQEPSVSALRWSEVRKLFHIPSYVLMPVSRLVSGHLLL
jgi:hypothetical protein